MSDFYNLIASMFFLLDLIANGEKILIEKKNRIL